LAELQCTGWRIFQQPVDRRHPFRREKLRCRQHQVFGCHHLRDFVGNGKLR
jgi:hypothetical protein